MNGVFLPLNRSRGSVIASFRSSPFRSRVGPSGLCPAFFAFRTKRLNSSKLKAVTRGAPGKNRPFLFKVVNRMSEGPTTISGSHMQDHLRSHNSAQDSVGAYNFSEGYLEWNDLFPSSQTESTFKVSSTNFDDDYFDPDALLCELGTPVIPENTKKENADCRFSLSASQGSQVPVPPPHPADASMPSIRIRGSTNTNAFAGIPKELHSKKARKQAPCNRKKMNQGLLTSRAASVSGKTLGRISKPRSKNRFVPHF